MIVVSDTSPLNYLILIQQVDLLPQLFGRVVTPPAVIAEMIHPHAPVAVRAWATAPPAWLEIVESAISPVEASLGPGESAAIALAVQLHADLLLLDERKAINVAKLQGLAAVGMLAVLDLAAERRLISLVEVIARLRATTFRLPETVVQELLRRDADRFSPGV